MRLSKAEILAIKEAVYEFDPDAKIFLFGSRIDDTQKGGDIDLLLITDKIKNREKRKIKIKISDKIGAQKIDIIVFATPKTQFEKSIYKHSIPL